MPMQYKMGATPGSGGRAMGRVGGRGRFLVWLAGLAIIFSGCAAPPPTQSTAGAPDGQAAPARSSAPKTLSMASIREPTEGVVVFAGSGNILAQFGWIFHEGLT